jgi:hypothetical protein
MGLLRLRPRDDCTSSSHQRSAGVLRLVSLRPSVRLDVVCPFVHLSSRPFVLRSCAPSSSCHRAPSSCCLRGCWRIGLFGIGTLCHCRADGFIQCCHMTLSCADFLSSAHTFGGFAMPPPPRQLPTGLAAPASSQMVLARVPEQCSTVQRKRKAAPLLCSACGDFDVAQGVPRRHLRRLCAHSTMCRWHALRSSACASA